MPCAPPGNASNHKACSVPVRASMPQPSTLGPRRTFAQGFLKARQGRGQRCFVQAIGQGAIPGDADEGSDVPPQIVHRPGDRIRHLGLVHTELVVLALGVIVKVWLVLEAVEAQELYWLALD